MTNDYINYEWEHKKAALDFEIQQAESQLASVEKRLQFMKSDIWVYFLYIAAPYVLIMLVEFMRLTSFAANMILGVIHSFLIVPYFFSLPLTLHHFVRSIILHLLNSRKSGSFPTPSIRPSYRTGDPSPEPSYQQEKEKLIWILNKYYLYRDNMNRLKKELDETDFTMSKTQLQDYFDQMPFYVEIRPANPFSSDAVKKARWITLAVFLVLISSIVWLLFY